VATAISTALLLALLLALLWPTATGSAASKYVARGRGAHDLAQTQAVAAQIARRTVATTLLFIWTKSAEQILESIGRLYTDLLCGTLEPGDGYFRVLTGKLYSHR
jgi:hypothetical protein